MCNNFIMSYHIMYQNLMHILEARNYYIKLKIEYTIKIGIMKTK